MSRKEKLLKQLKGLKVKLEIKKRRFELWEEEICKKDEEGYATAEDIKKENMFWRKKRRLEYRIDFINDKIFELKRSWIDRIKNVFKGAI